MMKKYIEIITMVVGLIASAATLIESFEAPGFGKQKKDAVINLPKMHRLLRERGILDRALVSDGYASVLKAATSAGA